MTPIIWRAFKNSLWLFIFPILLIGMGIWDAVSRGISMRLDMDVISILYYFLMVPIIAYFLVSCLLFFLVEKRVGRFMLVLATVINAIIIQFIVMLISTVFIQFPDVGLAYFILMVPSAIIFIVLFIRSFMVQPMPSQNTSLQVNSSTSSL